MKLLIIAGPYEADRIRKTAVAAGFETVAVEPGESLSGWITASRPQLIVMAPQMVHADPALALAKVRSVPRGRVPIFLVGDEADESRMASLSEGFFVRPVSTEALLEHAKVVLAAERARESTNLGHEFPAGGRAPGSAKGAAAAASGAPAPLPGVGPRPSQAPGSAGRSGASLRPLVTAGVRSAPSVEGPRMAGDASALLAKLGAGIDAIFDAELTDAAAATPKLPPSGPVPETEFGAETTANMKLADVRPARPRDDIEQTGGARARILSRYALVEAGDYFQVLGISRDASAAEVQSAHDRVARELESETVDPGLAGELGVEIEAIRVVAGEALRILRDERLRPRYQSRLAT